MKYNQSKKTISFSKNDKQKLASLVNTLANRVRIENLGYYKTMTDEDIWMKIVSQFCVMGNATLMEALIKNDTRYRKFRSQISLKKLKKVIVERDKYIGNVLKEFKATRFYNQQGKRLDKLLNKPEVIKGGIRVLIRDLNHDQDFNYIRGVLMSRITSFKMKSASDFMINLGLSHDVMALDIRVVGILNEYFDLNLTVDEIQRSKELYKLVEDALRKECKTKAAILDRIIFHFSNINVLDYLLGEEVISY